MHDKIFDENSLREAIVGVWGEYGAHVEVYDILLKKLNELQTPPPDAEVREAVERASSLVTFGSHNVVIENKHIVSLLRAVQAPRLTGEQVEAAFREGYGLGNDDGRNIDVFCHIKQHNPESDPDFAWEYSEARRAAFPEAFAGQ